MANEWPKITGTQNKKKHFDTRYPKSHCPVTYSLLSPASPHTANTAEGSQHPNVYTLRLLTRREGHAQAA